MTPNNTQHIRNCKDILQPVALLLDQIDDNNHLLKPQTNRKRRAPLDFVGNILGDLFGVLDQRDAQKYHEQIEGLISGTVETQALLKKQIKILDMTSNIIRKEHLEINNQYRLLLNEIRVVMKHDEFLDAMFQLSTACFIYKDIQSDLIDILSDVHHGRASVRLIPPSQLITQLWEVNKQIPSGMEVPSYKTQWVHIYKLMKTKAATVRDQIIFEVSIPLVEGEEYGTYNIVPVPAPHKDSFVYLEPQFNYVLVSNHRAWYYPLSAEELKECRTWEKGIKICSLRGPMYKMPSGEEHCGMSLLTHRKNSPGQCQVRSNLPTTFIHQLLNNRWLLVLPQVATFDLLCQQQLQTVKLEGSGVLSLMPGCSLRGPSVLITASTSITTSGFSDIVPTFNLSQEVKDHAIEHDVKSLDEELTQLHNAMANLKQEEPWAKLDVHHTINYTSFGFVILLLLIILLSWYKRKRAQGNPLAQSKVVIMPRPRERSTSTVRENLV